MDETEQESSEIPDTFALHYCTWKGKNIIGEPYQVLNIDVNTHAYTFSLLGDICSMFAPQIYQVEGAIFISDMGMHFGHLRHTD